MSKICRIEKWSLKITSVSQKLALFRKTAVAMMKKKVSASWHKHSFCFGVCVEILTKSPPYTPENARAFTVCPYIHSIFILCACWTCQWSQEGYLFVLHTNKPKLSWKWSFENCQNYDRFSWVNFVCSAPFVRSRLLRWEAFNQKTAVAGRYSDVRCKCW